MAEVSRVRVGGPLEPYAGGFRASLARQGYRPSSAGRILRLMARFSSWLDAQSLSADGLTIEDAERFELACGAPAGRRGRLSGPMNRVVDHLIEVGVVMPAPAAAPGAAEVLLAGDGAYLTGERGLAAHSVCGYLRDARQFLAWRCGRCDGDVALGMLTARDVTDFVLAEHRRGSVASARRVVNAMRSFLGYLHVEGLTAGPLTSAVLSVPGWRGTSPPPEPLTPAEVKRLLSGFDQRSHLGRRDYAMVMVMLRLGLRAAEVAGLMPETSTGGKVRSSFPARAIAETGYRFQPRSGTPSPHIASRAGLASAIALCSCAGGRLMTGYRRARSATWSTAPERVPGFPAPPPIGFAAPWPATCCGQAPRCWPSAACCASGASRPRLSTQRPTSATSALSPGPGREVRHAPSCARPQMTTLPSAARSGSSWAATPGCCPSSLATWTTPGRPP